MKKSRKALLASVLSLLLCFSMLLGTTFAWFTDSVTSSNNIIKSGNLDIEMEYWDGKEWKAVKEDSPLFAEDTLWEPGYTQVVYLRVANKGTLALKYQLGINIVSETGGTNMAGDPFKLSDSIYMGVKEGVNGETGAYATREAAVEAVKDDSGIISKGFNKYGDMNAGAGEQYLAVVVYMPTTVENEANHKTGTDAPKITLGIKLLATQKAAETDSFGSDYDNAAQHPLGDINYSAAKTLAAEQVKADGTLAEAVTVGNESDGIYAEVPADVKLADGATELKLSVQAMDESNANITTNKGETAASLDVHVEGVAEDNQTPITINLGKILPTGLNSTSVALYHVENGVPVPMTEVANPVSHNEFSYDPATGEVVVAMAKFSEVAVVANASDPWNGTAASDFNGGVGTEADPYIIANEDQFAYFRNAVDGGNAFEDKFIQLNVDLDLNSVNFDPIGWGYTNADHNRDGAGGKPFSGTFNGNGNTIFGLYQNGWELGYSYTNCGGGLFASIANGTVRNLTISGANIVMECVEQGILVGLSQGDCTYENINIYDSKVANYQRATGGLIGEVSPLDGGGTTTISNVVIGSDVVVGSLWGDFDAPVGGVIGARWDDDNTTTITMTDVSVACVLDVYNDVTSTYQWYAYRRAGMLIGNTDTPPANGKDSATATADFLDCTRVTVYYGPWVNYHYCEFSNHNSNWPFVRVEAGENCSAFSNPRWGIPNDINGVQVTPENHSAQDYSIHKEGDDCYVLLKFNQLYGGGQGVYGQTKHDGVTVEEYLYTVTYINDSEVLDVKYVTEVDLNDDGTFSTANDVAKTAVVNWAQDKIEGAEIAFGGWMNAGSTKLEKIPAGNEENIVLYPFFTSPYTASFVDQGGNILAWCFFVGNEGDVDGTREIAETKLPTINGFDFDGWEVHATDDEGNTTTKETYDVNKFASYTTDVTIYPVYKYNGDVNLIPVDEDGDGDTDSYQVDGYSNTDAPTELVEIPGTVNGVPVTTINADAFSSYDDLHSVRIPGTITAINSQSFTADDPGQWGTQRDTVTLYYEGDPAVWKAAMEKYNADDYSGILKEKWDNAMGEGSRVFFLDANGKVINTSYWELNGDWKWILHEHAYTYEAAKNCSHGEDSHYEYGGGFFGYGGSLQEGEFTDYAGTCTCSSCDGATRPDAEYWTTSTTT